MKKVLVDKRNDLVLYIGNIANPVVNGIDVGNLIYPDAEQTAIYELDVPAGVSAHTHKYVGGQFTEYVDNIERFREEGREEIRGILREAMELDQLSGAAKDKIQEALTRRPK